MTDRQAENRLLLKKLVFITVLMFGFGFALVPLYEKICEVTGITQQRTAVTNTQVDLTRTVNLEFDANVNQALPWEFKAEVVQMKVHPGEMKQVMYRVKNLSDRPIVGHAVPSYGPARAGSYFKKIECFCFSEQILGPGEERLMPVQFVVQNDLPRDVHTITLSYTFYESTAKKGAGVDGSAS